MQWPGGTALELEAGGLQDHEHGKHDGVGLLVVRLLDAAHDEGVGILDARIPKHLRLGRVPMDEAEAAGALVLFLWQALHHCDHASGRRPYLILCARQ